LRRRRARHIPSGNAHPEVPETRPSASIREETTPHSHATAGRRKGGELTSIQHGSKRFIKRRSGDQSLTIRGCPPSRITSSDSGSEVRDTMIHPLLRERALCIASTLGLLAAVVLFSPVPSTIHMYIRPLSSPHGFPYFNCFPSNLAINPFLPASRFAESVTSCSVPVKAARTESEAKQVGTISSASHSIDLPPAPPARLARDLVGHEAARAPNHLRC
jgi:hypothetical protein